MLAGANNNNNDDEDDDDDSTVFIEIFLPHISNSSSSINDFFLSAFIVIRSHTFNYCYLLMSDDA